MHQNTRWILASTLILILFQFSNPSYAQSSTQQLIPQQDACIYSELTDEGNQKSNGLGKEFLIGRTNSGSLRRALIKFDLSTIPEGATIISASLNLHLNKAAATDTSTVSMYRLLQAWQEGTSIPASTGNGISANPGDVSWQYADLDSVEWERPGAFFDSVPVAQLMVDKTVGNKTWNDLAAEIQFLLNNPALNHGWLLKDEEDVNGSVRKFGTKEDTIKSPILEITYMQTTQISQHFNDPYIRGPFPNPTRGLCFVELWSNDNGKINLQVMDIMGRLISQKSFHLKAKTLNKIPIEVPYGSKGIHFIQLNNYHLFYRRKLFIR